jgi:hypothetical protein
VSAWVNSLQYAVLMACRSSDAELAALQVIARGDSRKTARWTEVMSQVMAGMAGSEAATPIVWRYEPALRQRRVTRARHERVFVGTISDDRINGQTGHSRLAGDDAGRRRTALRFERRFDRAAARGGILISSDRD